MTTVATRPDIIDVRDGMSLEGHEYPPGVRVWRNSKNRFFVFELHYSANERKRATDWRSGVAATMTRAAFQQEYEIKWDTFHGMPVYPDYDPRIHEAKEEIRAEQGLTLLRGWDWGLTPACVVCQVQGTRLVVLREFTESNMGAERFIPKVLKECAVLWPNWSDPRRDWRDFIDPAGFGRKDTDEKTCAEFMYPYGLQPIAGAVVWEERRSSVEKWLVKRDRGGPCFQVNAALAPMIAKGFRGGYRYPEKAAEIEPAQLRPIKDMHSHPADALQMVTSRLEWAKTTPTVNVPTPSYKGASYG